MAEKEILSVREVPELLGCSPSHVRRLLNGNVPDVPRIPHMRAEGRVRLIRRIVVLAWLETLEQVTAGAAKAPPPSQRAKKRKAGE